MRHVVVLICLTGCIHADMRTSYKDQLQREGYDSHAAAVILKAWTRLQDDYGCKELPELKTSVNACLDEFGPEAIRLWARCIFRGCDEED